MLDGTGPALADTAPFCGSVGIEAIESADAVSGCDSWIAGKEEWKLANRIVISRGFRRSELLQRFLLEICELTLAGQSRNITEQYIGSRIFGRPEGYNPGEDNIVRSYARMLRRRLEVYFKEEGAHESLRINVPRGCYVPEFTPVLQEDVQELPPIEAASTNVQKLASPAPSATKPAKWLRWKWTALGAGIGVFAMVLVSALISTMQSYSHVSTAHALWAQMFEKRHNTIIVTADSGLGIVENLTHTETTLDRYASGRYLADAKPPTQMDEANFADVSRQHYTSSVDLGIASALTRLPEYTPDRTQIRFARDLRVQEMQNSNVILLGSVHTNPWVALFEPRLNFKLIYTPEVDQSYIVNRHPRSGEEKIYANGSADGRSPTYGVVAYLPDAGGVAHVLIIEGLNMASTDAASKILFDSNAIRPVLAAATSPGGHLHAFELLIETTSVGPAAPTAHIVATRIYPET